MRAAHMGARKTPASRKRGSRSTWGSTLFRFQFGFLQEVNLVVHGVVVIPVFLAAHVIPNAGKHGFVFKISLVSEFDAESKSIETIMYMLPSDIVGVLRSYFRNGFPVIKGESSCHTFVICKICHCHYAKQVILV